MTHKMGLANIKMAAATAANSKETLTLNGNTSTTQYSSTTTDNAFYALDEFVTNLPYKVGSRNTSGLSCYFIAHPASSYTFSTSYKYGDADANRQWNNFTISSSSNTITSSKYKEIATSIPKFKNLGRLYSYTGTCQTYTPTTLNVKYQIECWGAEGGQANDSYPTQGSGAYVSGYITMDNNQFYIYVGQKGVSTNNTGSWNGGGPKGAESNDGSGGGATDIRIIGTNGSTTWNDAAGLKSRIIVAAGGGGADDSNSSHIGGALDPKSCSKGGGVSAVSCSGSGSNAGATQTSGGRFISGTYSSDNNTASFGAGNSTAIIRCAGGGGGYWGGAASDLVGQGGSSYISGHAGCVAIASASSTSPSTAGSENSVERSKHYSGKYFTNTLMIDGGGYQWTTAIGSLKAMPNPTTANGTYSSGAGHTGNGYSRITCTPYD